MSDDDDDLHAILLHLKAHGPEDATMGICWNASNTIKHLAHDWPEYSGRCAYPVPHPTLNPGEAYNMADAEEMWSPDYPYGAARLRLLDWLIERTNPQSVTPVTDSL